MGFISKVELKKQLQALGVKVEGNYVRKSELGKFLDFKEVTAAKDFSYILKGNKDSLDKSMEIIKNNLAEISKITTNAASDIKYERRPASICITFKNPEFPLNVFSDFLSKILPEDTQIPYWR